ncbi:Na+/H+ antiporter subunit E [Mangrovibrevibacter kandeliae]|uniref:Na+/H+ antiporter subunit E n=1 Tax=Mangrovibrevibacter kandeliae TaxID=2968473 RepID=UPI0021193623|nr:MULTISPECIES: Na+/H+ antiporter subunit E [unclassified Aurantimonas]MCQ8780874.1 Na+/H+ antiporter subunit E [Aurantimonas sp. CSK15Z-1]MCW4113654.1 Na+/H+ antiporter subunit E [Aurantimonas sp. MSK8Z-1]
MTLFAINLVLTLIWAIVTGSFSLSNLALGFVLSAFSLFLIREQVGTAGYVERARRLVALALLFFWELLKSAFTVAKIVTRRRIDVKPGIFAYPLKVQSDFEISLLANLITLTPGTLSVDVSEDRSTLYVHALDCSDPDGTRRDIANGFERKIMEAFG